MGETVRLQLSNLCLDAQTVAFGGVDVHAEMLQRMQGNDAEGGFPGGYTLTPTNILATDLTCALEGRTFTNDMDRSGRVFAGGLEQSWGPGMREGLRRAARNWRHPGQAAGTVLRSAVMVESEASLGALREFSPALNYPLTVVRAEVPGPDGQPVSFQPFGFDRVGALLKPGLLMNLVPARPDSEGFLALDQGRLDALHLMLGGTGVDGLVVNGHWLQAEDEQNPGVYFDLRDPLAALGSPTAFSDEGVPILGLDFAVGRLDSRNPGDRRRSMQELAAAFESSEAIGRTALGDIMRVGYEAWRRQLRAAWYGFDAQVYDRTHRTFFANPNQWVTSVSTASQQMGVFRRLVDRVMVPPRLPVTLKVPSRALTEYHHERGGRVLSRATRLAMLSELAGNIGAFFSQIEVGHRGDTTPQLAQRVSADLGKVF